MFIPSFYHVSQVSRPNTKDIIFLTTKHFVIIYEIVLNLNSESQTPSPVNIKDKVFFKAKLKTIIFT